MKDKFERHGEVNGKRWGAGIVSFGFCNEPLRQHLTPKQGYIRVLLSERINLSVTLFLFKQ